MASLEKHTNTHKYTNLDFIEHQVDIWAALLLYAYPFYLSQIIQIAPMPVVQTNVQPAGTVHPTGSFPVSVAAATVMASGTTTQTVLLTPSPTR